MVMVLKKDEGRSKMYVGKKISFIAFEKYLTHEITSISQEFLK